MPAQALAAVATLIGFAAHGNRIDLQLDRGAAELVWVSPSAFHFRRALEGPLAESRAPAGKAIEFTTDDLPGAVRIRSPFLEVTIQKHGALVRVRRLDSSPLLNDLTEPQASGAGVSWERQTLSGVRFYGLGPRADTVFDLTGRQQPADEPFLFCTAGYAEYHPTPGAYRFDFTSTERYGVHAPAVDYYFYYGPTQKQIFEEHNLVRGTAGSWQASTDRFPSWDTLKTSLLRLVQGAMSARLAPTFNLSLYATAPAELQQRARQLGSLVPEVSPGKIGLSDLRHQLESFFTVYADEAHQKGFPTWHPLPFQFPDDPECARHADEFVLGDELLIAPIYESGNTRSLYLPQGNWTFLATDEVFPGRKTIRITTPGLPVFARNGAIVPLDSEAGMALHYFPKLGAEFFLLETDADAWTQVHAAPAADIMRLEIESKKPRDYQWAVHHVERPIEVGFEAEKFPEARPLRDRSWSYDASRKLLQIRVHVNAGEDSIVNLMFPE